jgi:integrase/recombinase XerD
MKGLEVTTQWILETRWKNESGIYPVKLRLTFDRTQKYYSLKKIIRDEGNYSTILKHPKLTEDDWKKVFGSNQDKRGDFKKIRQELTAIEKTLSDRIADMGDNFTFEKFEKINLKRSDKTLIRDVYLQRIKKDIESGRVGTASNYQCSMNSILNFSSKKNLSFKDIDKNFLEKYESWMQEHGRSLTTVGIYLRPLRSLFNDAIDEGIIKRETYPFAKTKYVIPGTSNKKKALSQDELKKMFTFETDNPYLLRTLDFWKFSYLCSGVNMKDIAFLKYKQIDFENSTFTFIREKTKRTTKNKPVKIVAYIPLLAMEIINRLGTKPRNPESYVFPIVSDEQTPQQKYIAVKSIIGNINRNLKRIAEQIGINPEISFYYARHSFATLLKRKGISTEFIKDSLGHSSVSVTESYLDGFEDKFKKSTSELLTNFD